MNREIAKLQEKLEKAESELDKYEETAKPVKRMTKKSISKKVALKAEKKE